MLTQYAHYNHTKNPLQFTMSKKKMHILYCNRFFYATWEQHSVFHLFSFILSVLLFSYLYVRVCVSVCETHSDCSVLSDGKLRIHCTKEKHRSAEAQAGVKPINNQMHFVVWSLVERTCCGTQVALIFCFQATMRTMTGFYADRFYGNPELQSCFCK